ncbi:hypothetical protein PEL8287_01271 [Roseovarius litorisediminis]|uniref:N-acetyltransferase domain-containing protein n=1 Tax=Roseovarius litorisediminis TaxID=1312363 RepID=A0A1Y5RY18_9RHOB|nr:GNAT family N-acetyltransferase [Roseovarius litorisediminis]SLN28258.1 hypothetical protein PEL8287_01271 [Roseovarius litorisediminis]
MTITPHAPTIYTADLILRGYVESDFDAFAAFGGSERSKFVGGPQSQWDSWRAFLAGIGHWMLRGYGMWMVEHRSSGETAGRVGMINNKGWDEPELGWHIYDGFEGKGYAYQASIAARDHAARYFGLNGVISYIDPANTRSVALARRLGAGFERVGQLLGKPCHIYRHPTLGVA